MKRVLWLLLISLLLCGVLSSCADDPATPPDGTGTTDPGAESADPGDTGSGETPEGPGTPIQPGEQTEVDVVLFIGGTNMAGRGDAAGSAECAEGHAYEFRAVSDPTRLYPMTAEFGSAENKNYGLQDGGRKTGSLVPAFCEAYYQSTQTPIVAVSASEGDTTVQDWGAGKGKLEDAAERLAAAVEFVGQSETYRVRRVLAVWCQGEADAEAGTVAADYIRGVEALFGALFRRGLETCLVIQTGASVAKPVQYEIIREAQLQLCSENDRFVMISDAFAGLLEMTAEGGGYTQEAYNLVGTGAGENAARYVLDPEGYTFVSASAEVEEEDQYNGPGIELPVDVWKKTED